MKRVIPLALFLLLLGLCACGDGGNPVSNIVGSVVSRLTGDVSGELGETCETEWFTFSVNSLEVVESYGEQEAEKGYRFLVANVYEQNTWAAAEAIPMSCYDFSILVKSEQEVSEEQEEQEEPKEKELYPEEPWDEAMMPASFTLESGEEVTYDLVFLIHDDVTDVDFVYKEVDENGKAHATYTVKHSLAD